MVRVDFARLAAKTYVFEDMSYSSFLSLPLVLVLATACTTRASKDEPRLDHSLVGPTATSVTSVTSATPATPSLAPSASATAPQGAVTPPTAKSTAPAASAAPRVRAGKKAEALELVIADPSFPNEGIFGCVSRDVVIVLPLHPGSPDWKVTNASKGFGAPRTTLREGLLGPSTPGQEFRWSTEKMKGGSYAIDFASGSDKVNVSVVLSCDD